MHINLSVATHCSMSALISTGMVNMLSLLVSHPGQLSLVQWLSVTAGE